jgi:signal transduction histidine kinase
MPRARRLRTARSKEKLRQEREERARATVADERARIARELHDLVAHNVSVMVVQAAGARRIAQADPARAEEAMAEVERTGRAALAEMRRMIVVMRQDGESATLAPQPGLYDIDTLMDTARAAGLPVHVRVEGEPRQLSPATDVSAYRILQEGLTNTLKHAGPACAEVLLRYGNGHIELEILDDGRGMDGTNGNVDGHGLVGMRERVAFCSGTLETGPRPEGGYRVRATLPVDPDVG